jgi:acetylornithine deacetylase
LPGFDPAEIRARFDKFAEEVVLPKLRKVAPTTNIETVPLVDVRGLAPEPGSLAEMLAMRFAGSNKTEAVAYATEAGLFQERGVASIICGPGDIAQAHQPDEFVDVSQIDACVAFMERLTEAARAGV